MLSLYKWQSWGPGWLREVPRMEWGRGKVCERVQSPHRLHAHPPPPSSLTRKHKSQHCPRVLPARLSPPEVLKRQAPVRPLRGSTELGTAGPGCCQGNRSSRSRQSRSLGTSEGWTCREGENLTLPNTYFMPGTSAASSHPPLQTSCVQPFAGVGVGGYVPLRISWKLWVLFPR